MKTKKKEERNVAKEMLLITEMSQRPLKCPTMILSTDINGNTFIEVISSSHSNRSLQRHWAYSLCNAYEKDQNAKLYLCYTSNTVEIYTFLEKTGKNENR